MQNLMWNVKLLQHKFPAQRKVPFHSWSKSNNNCRSNFVLHKDLQVIDQLKHFLVFLNKASNKACRVHCGIGAGECHNISSFLLCVFLMVLKSYIKSWMYNVGRWKHRHKKAVNTLIGTFHLHADIFVSCSFFGFRVSRSPFCAWNNKLNYIFPSQCQLPKANRRSCKHIRLKSFYFLKETCKV